MYTFIPEIKRLPNDYLSDIKRQKTVLYTPEKKVAIPVKTEPDYYKPTGTTVINTKIPDPFELPDYLRNTISVTDKQEAESNPYKPEGNSVINIKIPEPYQLPNYLRDIVSESNNQVNKESTKPDTTKDEELKDTEKNSKSFNEYFIYAFIALLVVSLLWWKFKSTKK